MLGGIKLSKRNGSKHKFASYAAFCTLPLLKPDSFSPHIFYTHSTTQSKPSTSSSTAQVYFRNTLKTRWDLRERVDLVSIKEKRKKERKKEKKRREKLKCVKNRSNNYNSSSHHFSNRLETFSISPRPCEARRVAVFDRSGLVSVICWGLIFDFEMAAPPARARADYDYLIKLLLIGDSGVGKSCLLLRFSDGSFTTSFITTIGIDFKIRTIELDNKRIKLQIWDTAGQERFRTITTAYYRGAMGILLVYDVTDESSFNNIRNWIRNIEQHASDNVNKILVGNKADMDESKRAVPTAKGQALADEYGIKFFETSAKTSLNVEEVFFSIARDIKQRLADSDAKPEEKTIKINKPDQGAGETSTATRSACCGS
ncbi:hypothetical protein LUZ60_011125 [Juncus effusus]|nr:hypothetical protein LUZ60_011125 [Juncus effusus]